MSYHRVQHLKKALLKANLRNIVLEGALRDFLIKCDKCGAPASEALYSRHHVAHTCEQLLCKSYFRRTIFTGEETPLVVRPVYHQGRILRILCEGEKSMADRNITTSLSNICDVLEQIPLNGEEWAPVNDWIPEVRAKLVIVRQLLRAVHVEKVVNETQEKTSEVSQVRRQNASDVFVAVLRKGLDLFERLAFRLRLWCESRKERKSEVWF